MAERLEVKEIQGVVARGYGALKESCYLLLSVEDPAGARATLQRLTAEVTTAERPPHRTALNLALTAHGVGTLTDDPGLVALFSSQFAAGMVGPHTSRFLGDLGDDSPETWSWGGADSDTVDLLLLVYAADPDLLARRCAELEETAHGGGLRVVHRLTTATLTPTESFGFRDGVSQPLLDGLGKGRTGGPSVRSGEFVLGYRNEYDQYAERPLLPSNADPERILPRASGDTADLGRNGSYLVFRQLEQDVRGFWDFVDDAARNDTGRVDEQRRELLAAKMMGRWRSGAPLVLAPERDDAALSEANDFGYHETDRQGLACPIGSHVRRTNPRDSLAPSPGSEDSLAINRKHRLLRRGRAYRVSDQDQGLHFICLNANLARQYEFVQHTWVNNPVFGGLRGEDDPVIGPRLSTRWFTEPARPVRRRLGKLPQFVRVRGGAYFFLPGISALRYLARQPR